MRYKSREWILDNLSHEELMRLHSNAKAIQARADTIFEVWGTKAPAPIDGEDPRKYQRDLARKIKNKLPYSNDRIEPDSKSNLFTFNALRNFDVYAIDDATFAAIEPQIYQAGKVAFARNDTVPEGEIRMVTKVDPANGLKTNEFYGRDHFIKLPNFGCETPEVRGGFRLGRRVAAFRDQTDDRGQPINWNRVP